MSQLSHAIEVVLFRSRFLLAPLYLGLVGALVLLGSNSQASSIGRLLSLAKFMTKSSALGSRSPSLVSITTHFTVAISTGLT